MINLERMRLAVQRITGWMRENDAPLLAENLAAGATAERLAQVEKELGFALPEDLKALWSLHDGQREEMNGFIESLDLLNTRYALGEREGTLMFVGFLRKSPSEWSETGVTEAEVRSDHWLAFASRDSDSLVISGVSGRVFSCGKDSPPLHLLAGSLAEWLDAYAARVEADDYELEEGFGDYYLQLRNRDAESREKERRDEAAERTRFRKKTPLAEQFRLALEQKDEDRCMEVVGDALERRDTKSLEDALEQLFAADPGPKFIAAALRPHLRNITLAPDRWVDVAVGGALLENNAIRDVAIGKCPGVSPQRLEELAAMVNGTAARLVAVVSGSAAAERKKLEVVLEKLRARQPAG